MKGKNKCTTPSTTPATNRHSKYPDNHTLKAIKFCIDVE